MAPEKHFYQNDGNFYPWKDEVRFELLDGYAINSVIKTSDGKELFAFLLPSNEVLGEGTIVIPIKVPTRKNKRKYIHEFRAEAFNNDDQFGHTNNLSKILEVFKITKGDVRRKGEFNFDIHSTIDGEWYLLINREIKRKAKWRNMEPDEDAGSAIGLGYSFVDMYDGWSIGPPPKDLWF